MAETFVKVSGLNRLIKRLDNLGSGIFTKQLMGEIATYVITSILQRTARGVDAERQGFEPYTPSYRLFREETDHQGSPVNLKYTGSMLSSISGLMVTGETNKLSVAEQPLSFLMTVTT